MENIFCLIIFLLSATCVIGTQRMVECVKAGSQFVPALRRLPQSTPAKTLNGSPSSVASDGLDVFGVGSDDAGVFQEPVVDALSQLANKVDIANAKINMIFEQCRTPTRRQRVGQLTSSGDCDLEDAGRCFWLVVYNSRNVSMLDGWETCAERPGGRPAGIYTPAHYARVVRLLRSRIKRPRYYTYVWIGMKVEHMTNTVYLPSGKSTPFVRWYTNRYPIRNSRFTQIYLYTDLTKASGFMNFDPERSTNGVLCETKF